MNTKHVSDRSERKELKRAARKKVAPKAKRASGVARGSMKKKVQKILDWPAPQKHVDSLELSFTILPDIH